MLEKMIIFLSIVSFIIVVIIFVLNKLFMRINLFFGVCLVFFFNFLKKLIVFLFGYRLYVWMVVVECFVIIFNECLIFLEKLLCEVM